MKRILTLIIVALATVIVNAPAFAASATIDAPVIDASATVSSETAVVESDDDMHTTAPTVQSSESKTICTVVVSGDDDECSGSIGR